LVRKHIFEHRTQPLLPRTKFLLRLGRSGLLAALLVGGSLAMGILGYHHFVGLAWIDSLLEASMILGGMGPINPIETTSGKLFASFYALYSGIAFLTTAAVLVAPVLHRFLHRFHIELAEDEVNDK